MNLDRDSGHPSHDYCIRQMIIMFGGLVLGTYCLIGLDISNKMRSSILITTRQRNDSLYRFINTEM